METTLYDTFALIQADKNKDDLVLKYHEQALTIVTNHVEEMN